VVFIQRNARNVRNATTASILALWPFRQLRFLRTFLAFTACVACVALDGNRALATPSINYLHVVYGRDVHGNVIPNGNGDLMGIPWEWK